ncbi:MAG TPA: hypothetical protein VJ805_07985 [Nitrospiraceae bacterium]|nr:hypothetical protein [Nitrospiraceae bacterium]
MRKVKGAEALWGIGLLAGLAVWVLFMTVAIAGPTARISQSGDVLELDYQEDGRSHTDTIPLYRTGEVQYFSAGVGVEERSATYPPFPLKLIFSAGGKPYVARVSVTVRQSNGPTMVTIPSEQITGPWLFLDLPEGSYHIEATMGGQIRRLEDIKVESGTQKTLYVRWLDDREPSRDTNAK